MLADFYKKLDLPEQIGKEIVIPDSSHEAIYLSEHGELFCYSGIHSKDTGKVFFEGWPYYLIGKHTKDCKEDIKGFFRIKDGCILLTGFVDHKFYNKKMYKSLNNYIVRLPVANSCYFGIQERIETSNSLYFEENKELSQACFGLTYNELEYFIKIYAERLGIDNRYTQFPKITRSMNKDNFCDITGIWIPPKFPYIAFNNSGYAFSHVSLYGFYRHIGAMISIGENTAATQIFKNKTFAGEIINGVEQINDYFPFEVKVTREIIFSQAYDLY
ncbi:hypothetical protein HZF24_04645 [Sedimentibacter hydroxybenzoicus DSM 7310]|uniref:Uncharacterized protein n=1 Tax=Sedimentibacter hydroxybenzoicus DSM 7310 TaxID=1123245 RepID=A0A974BHT8_SEDHY|nr:hypothetical protein [Sedimentibacter hydroxybenzoicus]NYB73425.1 hypothetical protein [Sedimentibacter hydroxybenzoicus DSM 7310]